MTSLYVAVSGIFFLLAAVAGTADLGRYADKDGGEVTMVVLAFLMAFFAAAVLLRMP